MVGWPHLLNANLKYLKYPSLVASVVPMLLVFRICLCTSLLLQQIANYISSVTKLKSISEAICLVHPFTQGGFEAPDKGECGVREEIVFKTPLLVRPFRGPGALRSGVLARPLQVELPHAWNPAVSRWPSDTTGQLTGRLSNHPTERRHSLCQEEECGRKYAHHKVHEEVCRPGTSKDFFS